MVATRRESRDHEESYRVSGFVNRARVGVIVVGYVLLMQVAESWLRHEFTKSSWPAY